MNYKKVILIVVLMTMAFMIQGFQVNALATCYQEQANISTTCGGLDSGTYSHSEEWDDGDWGTGKGWGGSNFDRYVNYTIPSITLKNVTIKTRIEYDPYVHTRVEAFTAIPDSCLTSSTLQFKIKSKYVFKNSRNLYLYCYNGSDWMQIYHKGWNYQLDGWFYEEGVYWVFNYPPRVTDAHIEPNPAWDFETLEGYCNASSDTDSTINISFKWYGNTGNVLLKNGTTIINNGEETLISTLSADERSSYEYEEIHLTCTPTDTNGEGSTESSPTIHLLSSPPPIIDAYMDPNGTDVLTTNKIKQYCYVDSASNYSINYTIYINNVQYINGSIENISSEKHETNVYNLTTADFDNLDQIILNCDVTNYAGSTTINSTETRVVESIINFTTKEITTNDLIENETYYLVDGGSIVEINKTKNYLSAGEHNITVEKEGYYNITRTIQVVEGEVATKEFSEIGTILYEVTAKDIYTNDTINNFTIQFYNAEYGTTTTKTTTNGTIQLFLLNKTYEVIIDNDEYSKKEYELTFTNNYKNETKYLIKGNTILFRFRDGETNNLITQEVNFELISDEESYQLNTTNGTIYKENLESGNYTGRIISPGYSTQLIYFEITNDKGKNETIYLFNTSETTQIEITILDETARPIEGAIVKALRYNINTNNYELQTSGQTNTEGKTYLPLTFNDEFYKFMIVYEGELKKVTTPSYITSTSIIIQINLGDEVLKNYYEYLSIDASLTFDTTTDEFKLTYNDEENIGNNYCLKIYELENNETTLINNECLTTSSGSIIIGVTPENGTTYIGKAYYDNNYLTQTSYTYPENEPIGKKGLFIQAIFMIGMTLLLVSKPEFIPLGLSSSLLFGRLIGLIQLPYQAIIGLFVVSIVITFVIQRRY